MCRSSGSPGGLPSTTGRRSSAGALAPDRAESGFTLLEVLIAFAVLAVMLVPILQVFGGGLGMTQTARGYAEGVLLARSKLAELSVAQNMREGESSGDFDERGYRWHASIITDHSVVTLPDDSVVGAPPAGGARRRPGTKASADAADTGSGSLFGRTRSGSASAGSSGQSNSLFGSSGSGSSSGQSSLFGRSSSSGSGSSGFGGSRSSFGSASGGTSKSSLSGSSSGSSGSQAGASPTVDEDGAREQAEAIPYRVAVTVEWGNAWSGGGAVTLSTLRLKQAGEQGRNRPE